MLLVPPQKLPKAARKQETAPWTVSYPDAAVARSSGRPRGRHTQPVRGEFTSGSPRARVCGESGESRKTIKSGHKPTKVPSNHFFHKPVRNFAFGRRGHVMCGWTCRTQNTPVKYTWWEKKKKAKGQLPIGLNDFRYMIRVPLLKNSNGGVRAIAYVVASPRPCRISDTLGI